MVSFEDILAFAAVDLEEAAILEGLTLQSLLAVIESRRCALETGEDD